MLLRANLDYNSVSYIPPCRSEFDHPQFEPAALFEMPRVSTTTTVRVVLCHDCRYYRNGGREISLASWYNHALYREGGARVQLLCIPSARLNKRRYSGSASDSVSNSDSNTDSDSDDASASSRPRKRQRTEPPENMEEDEPGWAPIHVQPDFQAGSDDSDQLVDGGPGGFANEEDEEDGEQRQDDDDEDEEKQEEPKHGPGRLAGKREDDTDDDDDDDLHSLDIGAFEPRLELSVPLMHVSRAAFGLRIPGRKNQLHVRGCYLGASTRRSTRSYSRLTFIDIRVPEPM
ncbi:hypothetical protein MKEN_01325200 [Mycena kentingensis (nom. inval.)]|nr:hypothetical protein MKEN_01325200 [Mycena kentingensis (nom. inval.)]